MLCEPDRANFDTLARAFGGGDVALVEVKRLADDARVAAICAAGREDYMFVLAPFAIREALPRAWSCDWSLLHFARDFL